MTEMLKKEFSRKSFVKGGGAMVVGFSMAGAVVGAKVAKAARSIRMRRWARSTRPRSTRG